MKKTLFVLVAFLLLGSMVFSVDFDGTKIIPDKAAANSKLGPVLSNLVKARQTAGANNARAFAARVGMKMRAVGNASLVPVIISP